MSFFIKSKPNNGIQSNKYTNKKARKRKLPKQQDDELTSSDDELPSKKTEFEVSSSEDENETAQEKKLRLAKIYLQEIEREEKQRLEDDENLETEVNGDVVSKRLREDYLRQAGRLKTTLAHKYTGADIDNFKILKCKEHKSSITCITVTSDDTYLYSGSKDGGIVKWSIEEGKKVGSLPFIKKNIVSTDTRIYGHSKRIICMAVSTDSKFLAIGDETNDIQIWNPENLQHIHTLCGHRGSVTGLVFRRETHTLYSCSKDRSVKVWSLDDMAYVETLYGHQDAITAIDALNRERAITAGGRDTTLRIWKIAEESQLIYNGHSGSIDIVKLINEENFVSGGDDGQLCIWGVNKKKPLCLVKDAHCCNPSNGQPYWISSVGSLINTDLIASGSQDGSIRIWKLGTSFRSIEPLFSIPIIGFVNTLSFTTNGKYLIAGVGTEHKFGRWDVIKSAKNSVVIIPLLKGS